MALFWHFCYLIETQIKADIKWKNKNIYVYYIESYIKILVMVPEKKFQDLI